MRAVLAQMWAGLWFVVLVILSIAAAIAVAGGPLLLTTVLGSEWWLALYTPHVLFSLYHLGADS